MTSRNIISNNLRQFFNHRASSSNEAYRQQRQPFLIQQRQPYLIQQRQLYQIQQRQSYQIQQHQQQQQQQQQRQRQRQIIIPLVPRTQQTHSNQSVRTGRRGRLINTQEHIITDIIDLSSPPSSPTPQIVQVTSSHPTERCNLTRIPDRVCEEDNRLGYKVNNFKYFIHMLLWPRIKTIIFQTFI